jgi:two-component system, NtrC family, nitrogen regulation response regulator NtrX
MNVLIVDDEGNLRRMLRALLEAEGYSVAEAESGAQALARVGAEPPEVVLLDLVFPGESGLDLLPRILDEVPGTPVIMMSGEATLGDAMEATRRGAFHFLEKPLTPEAVLVTLRGAIEVGRARDLSKALREELGPGAELVGESPEMERAREIIRKAAPTEARVLITGESGTGKELAASALHALSRRSGKPFVRVNSAAIPRDLVESEMFGHERGAFTGATERRRGRFELAHGGTLFLDEVGDLGEEAQAKLLRSLETGTVQRVGGSEPIQVDVRLVAATNRDLREEARAGRFREDLLFRLEVVPLHMPALRHRPGDISALLAHAGERLRMRQGLAPPRWTEAAVVLLREHQWPGNVRELMNLVERAAILHPGEPLGASEVRDLLGTGSRSPGPPALSVFQTSDERPLRDRLDDVERELIRGALLAAESNVAEAARLLRTDRANLYRRMRRLDLDPDAPLSPPTASGQEPRA